MAGKREGNPAGLSNILRGDVLRVLGVVKVATVEQIQWNVEPSRPPSRAALLSPLARLAPATVPGELTLAAWLAVGPEATADLAVFFARALQ